MLIVLIASARSSHLNRAIYSVKIGYSYPQAKDQLFNKQKCDLRITILLA